MTESKSYIRNLKNELFTKYKSINYKLIKKNSTEIYERFDNMLKEVDEEHRTTLINFAKYKLVMFAMAKLMEMETTEQNKVALYLFNLL